MPTFAELESENAKLRGNLAECRAYYTEMLAKFGHAATLACFPSDGSKDEIRIAIDDMKVAEYRRGFEAGRRCEHKLSHATHHDQKFPRV